MVLKPPGFSHAAPQFASGQWRHLPLDPRSHHHGPGVCEHLSHCAQMGQPTNWVSCSDICLPHTWNSYRSQTSDRSICNYVAIPGKQAPSSKPSHNSLSWTCENAGPSRGTQAQVPRKGLLRRLCRLPEGMATCNRQPRKCPGLHICSPYRLEHPFKTYRRGFIVHIKTKTLNCI